MAVLPAMPVGSNFDATLNFDHLRKVVEKLQTGAWTNPESFSAKVEETTTVQVRTEQGATVARLKGVCKAKEEIAVGSTIFTLPAGFRPTIYSHLLAGIDAAGTTLLVRVETTGAVVMETKIPAGRFFSFDGITLNLT